MRNLYSSYYELNRKIDVLKKEMDLKDKEVRKKIIESEQYKKENDE